jgi:hypothetical protein
MRLFNWAAGAMMLLAGCSNVDTSLTVLGAAFPESDDKCEFSATGEKFLENITFDALQSDSLALYLRVRNDLQTGQINFGSTMIPDTFTVPSSIQPLRMDFRFECDTNGFSDELGPFYVPQFSAEQPFCLQKDTREFQGFDVVPASGATIEANGGIGIVLVKPITTQLAHAMGETFILADLANECCKSLDNIGGCTEQNLRNLAPNGQDKCGELQKAFDKIAPDKLSVNKLDDIEKFRPYAIFNHISEPPRSNSSGPLAIGATYPMRLRGVLEGVTGDGSIVSSTEYYEEIHICANCNTPPSPCTAQ